MRSEKDSLQIIREEGKAPIVTQLLPEAGGMQAFEESAAAAKLDAVLAKIAAEQAAQAEIPSVAREKSKRRRGGRKTPYVLRPVIEGFDPLTLRIGGEVRPLEKEPYTEADWQILGLLADRDVL